MRSLVGKLAAGMLIAGITASSGALFSVNAEEAMSQKSTTSDDRIIGAIPPDSPFAKISLGMSMRHVYDLIGHPTDTKHYGTGKSFIPFYFGSDRVRFEAIYKGMGRITFTGSGQTVYRIVYDPNEKGYADSE